MYGLVGFVSWALVGFSFLREQKRLISWVLEENGEVGLFVFFFLPSLCVSLARFKCRTEVKLVFGCVWEEKVCYPVLSELRFQDASSFSAVQVWVGAIKLSCMGSFYFLMSSRKGMSECLMYRKVLTFTWSFILVECCVCFAALSGTKWSRAVDIRFTLAKPLLPRPIDDDVQKSPNKENLEEFAGDWKVLDNLRPALTHHGVIFLVLRTVPAK